MRDVQGVGRGGIPIAGTAGYCVGHLNIPGYDMPYESKTNEYPPSFSSPLKVYHIVSCIPKVDWFIIMMIKFFTDSN